jgi:SUMO ligase MMS21 Smc5/6 complex component
MLVNKMKSSLKYLAAAPMEIAGNNEIENIMNISLNVSKDGDVNLCFIDSVKSKEDIYSQQITESAYPNEGELLFSKQGLWLSMFTRHMDETSIMEIEIEE